MSLRVIRDLLDALGEDLVSLPPSFGERRFADWSGIAADSPLALLRPRNTQQVSSALEICHRHGQPVATQGGLTGLAGGATVRAGEIALSLERMCAIEELDSVSATMTVQAGAILQKVQEAADAAGFFFPLDLGARGSCTIGGTLGTNAGGNRVIKYGMMRDQVLGLEAVLADGRVIGGLHKMLKNNTGYDLRNLIVGSEGTLAVVTRAVLRLRPRPAGVTTAWCGVPDFASVTTLLRRAQAGLTGQVSAFEVMWPSYYNFVLEMSAALRPPLQAAHGFHIILETDGADPEAQAAEFESFLARMMEDGVIADAVIAKSTQDARDFWAIRDAPGEFPRLMPNLIGFDISFATSKLAAVAARCDSVMREKWPGSVALFYGHLGDGNLHLIVDVPRSTKETIRAVEVEIYKIVAEYGGSVSAEHGIGMKKREVLSITRTAAERDVMGSIRAALDPRGILNPGRVLGG